MMCLVFLCILHVTWLRVLGLFVLFVLNVSFLAVWLYVPLWDILVAQRVGCRPGGQSLLFRSVVVSVEDFRVCDEHRSCQKLQRLVGLFVSPVLLDIYAGGCNLWDFSVLPPGPCHLAIIYTLPCFGNPHLVQCFLLYWYCLFVYILPMML